MPKIKRINSSETNVSGTCFADSMLASYKDIFDKLGPPCDSFDNYKSDAEWVLEFEDGTVATIYNWKNGKNYCGEDGYDIEDIPEWHIGAHEKIAASWVVDFIKNSWPIFDDIRQDAQV